MSKLESLKAQFDEKRASYQQALDHITGELSSLLDQHQIKIHSLKFRIKEFDSFYHKVQRKPYSRPFQQCTDIAACRVVCLFQDQVPTIVRLFKEHFEVKEEIRKKKKHDQFSYRSHHLVIFREKIPCEVQVRTILQEAWAEIEHYVNYKHVGVQEEYIRKVNALAALFEIADDQFRTIHQNYLELKDTHALMKKEEMTPILLYHYCKSQFPWAWQHQHLFDQLDNLNSYARILEQCQKKRIHSIGELHRQYQSHKKELLALEQPHIDQIVNNPIQWPSFYERVKKTGHFFTPTLILQRLIDDFLN